MLKLISVIVPIYKVEEYLERCIKSIVSQTYKNIEIILVDDGSPDNCPAICDEWRERDSRIKVVHKRNGGLSDARNTGIKIASGDYVVFVDSDDYIHPQFVDALYYVIKKYSADVVSCDFKLVSETYSNEKMSKIELEKIKVKEDFIISQKTIGIVAWNKMYKKELFDKIQFPVGKIHEDSGIWWKVVYYASKIVAISEILYYQYENVDSITRRPYTKVHMDLVDVLYAQYVEFKKMLEDAYAGQVLEDCLNMYPIIFMCMKNARTFDKEFQKIFFQSYKQKVKIALKDGNVRKKMKIKHFIYLKFPFTMRMGRTCKMLIT